MNHGEQLDLWSKQWVEPVQVEQALIASDGQINQFCTRAFSQQLPRHDIAVVLHFGEQDLVTGFEITVTPSVGDEIDPFGGAEGWGGAVKRTNPPTKKSQKSQ